MRSKIATINRLITSHSFLLLLTIQVINAQSQKPKVYIDGATAERYSQAQFDSLTQVTTLEPDKLVSMTKVQELAHETHLTFYVLTVKSIASVRRNWLNKRLPAFSFEDPTGRIYDNTSIAGRVVVLNLWSITCHPCIEEMPWLNQLVNRYAAQGVLFLALAPEARSTIDTILSKHIFLYTILSQTQAFSKALDAPGYPYHIVIDQAGYMRYIQSGTKNSKTGEMIAETELPKAIEDALK